MNQYIGHAFCAQCSVYMTNISLTGEYVENESGERSYKCENNQFCIFCGQEFEWMNVPGRSSMLFDVEQLEKRFTLTAIKKSAG